MLFVAYKKSISIEGNKINTYVVEFGSKLFHSNFNNAQIILKNLHGSPVRDIQYAKLLRTVTKEVLFLILSCMYYEQKFRLIRNLIFYVS